jgi:hypothetical protein
MVVHILTEYASSKCFFFFKTCQKMSFPWHHYRASGCYQHSIFSTEASKHGIQLKRYSKISSHHFQSSLSGAQRWIRPTAHQIKNCLSNGLTGLNLA